MMGGMDEDQIRVHDLEEGPSESDEGSGDEDGAGDSKGEGGGEGKVAADEEEEDDKDDKKGSGDDAAKKSGEEESGSEESGSDESGSGEESGEEESGSEEDGGEESDAGEGATSVPAEVEKPLLNPDLQEGFALREDYSDLYGAESQVPLWATDEAGKESGVMRRGSSGGNSTPARARPSGGEEPADQGGMNAMDALLAAATGQDPGAGTGEACPPPRLCSFTTARSRTHLCPGDANVPLANRVFVEEFASFQTQPEERGS